MNGSVTVLILQFFFSRTVELPLIIVVRFVNIQLPLVFFFTRLPTSAQKIRYLESVRPFVSAADLSRTRENLRILCEGEDGKRLQGILEKRARENGKQCFYIIYSGVSIYRAFYIA